jgi:hypothetical protein
VCLGHRRSSSERQKKRHKKLKTHPLPFHSVPYPATAKPKPTDNTTESLPQENTEIALLMHKFAYKKWKTVEEKHERKSSKKKSLAPPSLRGMAATVGVGVGVVAKGAGVAALCCCC